MMKKEIKLFLALLLSALLLVGCTQQPATPPTPNQTPPPPQNNTPPQNQSAPPLNQTPPPANNTPPPPVTSTGMEQIYKYGSLKSYEYKLTSKAGGQVNSMNVKTSVSSDTVNGTAAWLQETDLSVQGTTIISKTWVDKVTYKCLKVITVMDYGGQTIEQAGTCPQEGPNSALRTSVETPKVDHIGSESVTVPAGTFNCEKYSAEGVTYWATSSIPIPVKVTYAGDTVIMELVSYTS